MKPHSWFLLSIFGGVLLLAYVNYRTPLRRDVIDITNPIRPLNKALLVNSGVRHPLTSLYVRGPGMTKTVLVGDMDSLGRFSFADGVWSKDGHVIACLISSKPENGALLYGFAFDFDTRTAYQPSWQSADVLSFPSEIQDLLKAHGGAVPLNIDLKSDKTRTRKAWFWEFW